MASSKGQMPSGPGPFVASGSKVVLVVSRGPSPAPRAGAAPVPDVKGKPQGDALNRVQAAGLNAQVFNDFNDKIRRGHVVDQHPLAGQMEASNSEVILLVSNGPAEATAPTALPDVVGLPEAEAVERLRASGLVAEVVRDTHPNVAEGLVFAQLPSQASIAGAKRGGSLVWLWIALAVIVLAVLGYFAFAAFSGKNASVPNVTGITQTQAVQVLTAAGFKVGTVTPVESSKVKAGFVATQTPPPGAIAKTGTSIALGVVAPPAPVNVPDVTGASGDSAQRTLEAAGFVVKKDSVYSDTVPQNIVGSQSPAGGTSATKGSSVTITVSKGPQNVNVTLPDFTGMTQNDAVNKAVGLGLSTKISQEYSSKANAGIVSSQIPDAGQSVAPGTTVGLTVSLGPAPPSSVTVPDLSGQTSANAKSALTALGLVPAEVPWDTTGKPAEQVVGQSPAAGAQVAAGSTVVVFVSSGK